MNVDQAFQYIGKPYAADGKGPDNFNCWGLIYDVRKHYFPVALPIIPIGDEETCRDIFEAKVQSKHWMEVTEPQHGDCALLRGGRSPHVGIYLNIDGGGILHSLEGVGVIFTYTSKLRASGYSRIKYYRILK